MRTRLSGVEEHRSSWQGRNYIETIFINNFKRNVRPFDCSHSFDGHRDKKEQEAVNPSGKKNFRESDSKRNNLAVYNLLSKITLDLSLAYF